MQKNFLNGKKGTVAIFTGDAPLITEETIKSLLESSWKRKFMLLYLTSIMDDPTGYGRIIRDEKVKLLKIVEHKDCNEEELKVKEINSGMYCFDIEELSWIA